MIKRTIQFVAICVLVFSCKKDAVIIPDNDAPYYGEVPTVKVENYINRLFIDLIGREALDAEMATELANLRAADLSIESRETLIKKLQTDLTWIQGDSSYKYAYYYRMYELTKVRLLEGATDGTILYYKGLIENQIVQDSIGGDTMQLNIDRERATKCLRVIQSRVQYMLDSIEINEMYALMLDNAVYDEINMNSFNFVRASFNNLFFRYPTQNEFDIAYDMVEDDKPGVLFGKNGHCKGDYIQILVNSTEYYEGMVRWLYQTFLSRNPTPNELYVMMKYYHVDHDVQKAQMNIMKTDEYANF